MPMRSAIHYPDIHLKSKRSMATALLLWDELRVITPWDAFEVHYHSTDMAAAWELVGRPMTPDDAQKGQADRAILGLFKHLESRRYECPADLRPDHEYEMYAEKLFPQTWRELHRYGVVGERWASQNYSLNQQAGIAIMAKLADACAGDVFARVTDRLMAYGLIGDRHEPVLPHSHVVPMTLELIDAASITLDRVIDFRRREASERKGGDYRAWCHAYADAIQAQIVALKGVESVHHRDELNRQFRGEMRRHLSELERAIDIAGLEFVLKPAVISVAVAGAGFLAAGPAGGFAGLAAGPALQAVAGLFNAGIGFSERQRNAMNDNPMSYMYQLARA